MAKAAALKDKEHVHKLKRHKYPGGTAIFFCILDCNFKIDAPFALGKQSICHLCGNEFTMTEASIRLTRPHCQNCGKFKVVDENGNAKFIQKSRQPQAIADMGKQAVGSLKDRLGKVVAVQDEDI